MPRAHASATCPVRAPCRPAEYKRREPEGTVLHALFTEHLASFLALTSASDTGGLPRFVVKELRGFVDCGILQKGFARFRCTACGLERLVAFSCKGRGFCPSCGAKRMTQLAAHLVDKVVPVAPTRQYVLSLPWHLRHAVAYNHVAQKAVVGIYARALMDSYVRRAKERGIPNGRTGAVTFIQRFGSSLNLNLHLHTHVIDGVFTENDGGTLRFHALPPPTQRDIYIIASIVRGHVLDLAVAMRLHENAPPDAGSEALAHLMGASAQHLRALGPWSGAPIHRLFGVDPHLAGRPKSRLSAEYDGFNLHAGLTVRARKRDVLERVMRYCLRPPLSHDRVERLSDGRIRLALKTPWSDGTSHIVFEPLEFLGKLTALIPRPHKNLVVYHGVLAPRSKWRRRVVAHGRPKNATVPIATTPASDTTASPAPANATPTCAPRHHNTAWAAMMRRAFELDVLSCPRCAGRLHLIACVTEPLAIRAILAHLSLPTNAPVPQPARAPPSGAAADGIDVADHDGDFDPDPDRHDAIDADPDAA